MVKGILSSMWLIGATTSSPLWPAGQLLMERLPEMKSFWTSTTMRALRGFKIFLIQFFQQKLNSSLFSSPSPLLLKMLKISTTVWESTWDRLLQWDHPISLFDFKTSHLCLISFDRDLKTSYGVPCSFLKRVLHKDVNSVILRAPSLEHISTCQIFQMLKIFKYWELLPCNIILLLKWDRRSVHLKTWLYQTEEKQKLSDCIQFKDPLVSLGTQGCLCGRCSGLSIDFACCLHAAF